MHPVAAHALFQLAQQRQTLLLDEGIRCCKVGDCVARLDDRDGIDECVRKTHDAALEAKKFAQDVAEAAEAEAEAALPCRQMAGRMAKRLKASTKASFDDCSSEVRCISALCSTTMPTAVGNPTRFERRAQEDDQPLQNRVEKKKLAKKKLDETVTQESQTHGADATTDPSAPSVGEKFADLDQVSFMYYLVGSCAIHCA